MSVWTTQESGLPPLAAGWPETFARRFGAFALRARLVLALTGGLLAALAVLLILLPGRPPAPVVRDPGIGAWVRKPELAPRLAVRDPSLAGLPQSGALWSRPHGDRTDIEDRLTVGDMEGTGRFLLIAAARSAGDASDTSLFVASARLAANAGLAVSRFAAERPGGASRAGRFAPMETALVSLARVFPSGVVAGSVSRMARARRLRHHAFRLRLSAGRPIGQRDGSRLPASRSGGPAGRGRRSARGAADVAAGKRLPVRAAGRRQNRPQELTQRDRAKANCGEAERDAKLHLVAICSRSGNFNSARPLHETA